MTKLDWALHYHRQGLRVFFTPPDVTGFYPKESYGGLLRSKAVKQGLSEADITAFLIENPDANIAVFPINMSVVDVDNKNPNHGNGYDVLRKAGKEKILESALSVRTPSGCNHYYFQKTDWLPEVFNATDENPKGFDVRNSNKGLLWVPPSSMHDDKKSGSYEWERGDGDFSKLPIFPYEGDNWFLVECGRKSPTPEHATQKNKSNEHLVDIYALQDDGMPVYGGIYQLRDMGFYTELDRLRRYGDRDGYRSKYEEVIQYLLRQAFLNFRCRCPKGKCQKHEPILAQPHSYPSGELRGISTWYPIVWGQSTAYGLPKGNSRSRELMYEVDPNWEMPLPPDYIVYPNYPLKVKQGGHRTVIQPAMLPLKTKKPFGLKDIERLIYPSS